MSTTVSVGRNEALEGLRGLACLNVYLAHFLFPFFPYLAYYQGFNPPPVAPTYDFERYLRWPIFSVFFNGTSAVCLFFVLSGYVLSRGFVLSGDRRIPLLGAIKRYPRLVIPVFASVLFAFALQRVGAMHVSADPRLGLAGWVLGAFGQNVSFMSAIFDGLLGAPLIGDNQYLTLNGVLWTIRIEIVGSLMIFGCYFVLGRRVAAPAAASLLSFCSLAPTLFVPFALGAAICHLEPYLRRTPTWLGPVLAVAGLFFLGFDYSPVYSWLPFHHVDYTSILGVAKIINSATVFFDLGSALIVVAILQSAFVARVFATPLLARFGGISFGVYLLHWPLFCSLSTRVAQALLECGLPRVTSIALTFVVSLAAVSAAAVLFRRLVDEPSRRLLDRLTRAGQFERFAEAVLRIRPVWVAVAPRISTRGKFV